MSGELGKASLDLTADTSGLDEGRLSVGRMDDSLDALSAVAKIAEDALASVKMGAGQAAESKATGETILRGVKGLSDEAREAARLLGNVKLSATQAAESDAAGDVIDTKLKEIKRNADEANRSLDKVRLGGGRNGVGVGPIGSGFGRIGVLGSAVGAGALTAPAAGPAIGGLLASIPSLAAGGIGALGTLALAFDGVTKAIGGDKAAFDKLGPSAQQFTLTIRSLGGWFDKLKQTAGSNLFPGLTAGLKSALSPGTVAAITKAVAEFGQAIGQAGAQWGRYFGSTEFGSIFGPLMASAARNLKTVSGAALSLFDALGVLGRAAIPLTSWMTQGIANAARLTDNWLHAKDATGQLSGAMDEAKTSLQLVGNLLGSLFNAVKALGTALYPVSKVAVKDLTDGLNALAGIIQRNQTGIRNIVGGALSAFVATIKGATPIVRTLASVLSAVVGQVGGWKKAFEGLFLLGIATKLNSIGNKIIGIGNAWKTTAASTTAATAVVEADTAAIGTAATVAEGEAIGLRGALLSLGAPEVLAAIAAAVGAYEGFKLGKKLQGAPNNGGYGTPAANAAAAAHPNQWVNAKGQPVNPETGKRINPNAVTTPFHPTLKLPATITDSINAAYAGHGNLAKANAAAYAYYENQLQAPGLSMNDKQSIYSAEAPYAPPPKASTVFTKPKPFTTGLGPKPAKPPVIPPLASHAEALASLNATKASSLGNVGETATRYLDNELADLTTATRLLRTKYESSTGAARTELFAAMTRVQNKITTVRTQLKKTLASDRAAELQFAVDEAKDAVAGATVGSAAYKKAVTAEEHALRAQIAYLDARAKNSKLSLAARSAALRTETADKKTLAGLLKPTLQTSSDVAANESQFLSDYAAIAENFAPNASPTPGATDTHLYEIKHELRQQTPLLKAGLKKSKFPSSEYAGSTAVTG